MKEQILQQCLKKGILLDSEALEFLISFNDLTKISLIVERLGNLPVKIVNKKTINEAIYVTEERKNGGRFEQRDYELIEPNARIVSSWVFPARKIVVGDFVKHFRSRFMEISKILQSRAESENLVSIDRISGNRQSISVIGMVVDKRITKNKNIMLEIEDLTGRSVFLANQNKKEVYEVAKEVILDD